VADPSTSRREFIATSSKAAFGAMIVPRHVLGGPGFQAPSDTLNVAVVGAGGMGRENSLRLLDENLVAFCDVDFGYVERRIQELLDSDNEERAARGQRLKEQYQAAAKYADFREMLAGSPEIDAVVVATPDHLHAVVAQHCMEEGKHVYVQKPLTWSVHEARVLGRVARETGVVTQMGNQGHSADDARLVNEWVQAGIIGPVREVHVWTNRPIWPQGLPAPKYPPQERDPAEMTSWWPGDVSGLVAEAIGRDYPMPEGFHWDLWKGPAVTELDYHPIFHPFHWRGWFPFGVGALGDMGAHLLDHPYWALGLTYPETIEATSTPWGGGSENPVTYPLAMKVHYEFPRRGILPPVALHWYDGGLMPRRPDLLPDDVALDRGGGVIFVGERGLLMHETYGGNPRLFPEGLQEEADLVPATYARVPDEVHERNWAEACKGNGTAVSPFSYAAPLTEVMLLGLVALRSGQGRKIHYDSDTMRVTNHEPANQYLTREYRPGWEVT
jgi:predicted dehydrogenase